MLRVKEIWIRNDRQFKDFYLDLSNLPDDGRNICFIGSNGTGKSTLLRTVKNLLVAGQGQAQGAYPEEIPYIRQKEAMEQAARVDCGETSFSYLRIGKNSRVGITEELPSLRNLRSESNYPQAPRPPPVFGYNEPRTFSGSKGVSTALIAYCPPEDNPKANGKLPTLSEAQDLLTDHSLVREIGNRSITGFWKQLTFAVSQRALARERFMEQPEHQDLSVKDARKKFDAQFPDVLEGLSSSWSAILAQAGLKLDIEGAKLPIQLTESLEANLRLANSEDPLPYEHLSTGIRMYLYRIGYLYSLFFRNDIQNSLLLLDEPESSLFPDFVYDLLAHYRAAVSEDTQIIAATHDPIFASQFHPECRFILEFNDDGYVTARPGVSPKGDDPNDLLRRDFGMKTVYGEAGLTAWRRYLDIRQKLGGELQNEERIKLAREYMELGTQYNFPEKDEISAEG